MLCSRLCIKHTNLEVLERRERVLVYLCQPVVRQVEHPDRRGLGEGPRGQRRQPVAGQPEAAEGPQAGQGPGGKLSRHLVLPQVQGAQGGGQGPQGGLGHLPQAVGVQGKVLQGRRPVQQVAAGTEKTKGTNLVHNRRVFRHFS